MKNLFQPILLAATLLFAAGSAQAASGETELIAVLQSSTDAVAKCDACRKLRVIGSTQAVPALAALLNDDRVSQAARDALDGMRFPEATAALRAALNKTSGLNKAGVVDSLGWKGDTDSIPALASLAGDRDAVIASAAVSALGHIGTEKATAALLSAGDKVPAAAQFEYFHALLRAADALLAAKDAKGAAKIYARLDTVNTPAPIRLAAWRGNVMTQTPKRRADAIMEAVSGSDEPLRLVALKVLREAADNTVVAEGVRRWSTLAPDAQVAVLDAAHPFEKEQAKLLKLAGTSASPAVRTAVWQALAERPETSAEELGLVARALASADASEAQAARDTLVCLKSRNVSAQLQKLAATEERLRPDLLRVLGERSDSSASGMLVKFAGATGETQSAALEALRKLGDASTLVPLLELAASGGSEDKAAPILQAVGVIFRGLREKNAPAVSLLNKVNTMNPAQQRVLLPVLPELGIPAALERLLATQKEPDVETRRLGVRLLGTWPNATPANELLAIAGKADDNVTRTLAWRGVVSLAARETEPARKLALLRDILNSTARAEEKRAAIGELAQVPTPEALMLLRGQLANADVRDEAGLATISIAEKIIGTNPELAKDSAREVQAAVKNPDIASRAALLTAPKPQSGEFIQHWLVAGPFSKPGVTGADGVFDVPFGPEKGETVQWKALPAGDHANLSAIFPGQENCAAYLKAQLFCPAPVDGTLLVGSDDGVKAWLNGKVVHSNNIDRGMAPDQDRAPIHLNAGTNELMLKITQGGGGWIACARVVGADGKPVPGLRAERVSAPLARRGKKPAPAAPVKVVAAKLPPKDHFQKIQITDQFYAEGAYCADFNKDGKLDLVAGPFWFEGPQFKTRHEYRAVKAFEAAKEYSDNFLTYTGDFNNDGWPDILCVPFPGKEGYWYENPQGKEGAWKQHLAYDMIGNESPVWGDVTGAGHPQLLICNEGFLGYIDPDGAKPDQPWRFHAISTQDKRYQRFTHGIGFGDVNGDGRNDVLEAAGWWEQPATITDGQPWLWHPFKFAEAGAQMYVYDVDGDGFKDVITSWHCHHYGLLWWQQKRAPDGAVTWVQHAILPPAPDVGSPDFRVSQMHAMVLADMNGDGVLDIVTGKRFWAHGPTGDVEPDAPAVVFWFELRREGAGGVSFVPHLIDDNSGVGTQVAAFDLNADKRPDIVVANKKGIFVHLSQKPLANTSK